MVSTSDVQGSIPSSCKRGEEKERERGRKEKGKKGNGRGGNRGESTTEKKVFIIMNL